MDTQTKRAIRIINNQLFSYNKDPIEGLTFEPDLEDTLKHNFCLLGPQESPWADCILNGYVKFPVNYPFSPPEIKFETRSLHPNIYTDGKVCLSILNSTQDETGYFQQCELWSPALDLRCVFICILNLFTEPNLESPANLDACIAYRTDIRKFTKSVRVLFEL